MRFKKTRPSAAAPVRSNPGDAGFDLTVTAPPKPVQGKVYTHIHLDNTWQFTKLPPGAAASFPLGLQLEIPYGYEGSIRSRSGLGAMRGIVVRQGVGTIDAGYRGEVCVVLQNNSDIDYTITNGDRVAQIVVSPINDKEWEEVDELDNAVRGESGFGSSGT